MLTHTFVIPSGSPPNRRAVAEESLNEVSGKTIILFYKHALRDPSTHCDARSG